MSGVNPGKLPCTGGLMRLPTIEMTIFERDSVLIDYAVAKIEDVQTCLPSRLPSTCLGERIDANDRIGLSGLAAGYADFNRHFTKTEELGARAECQSLEEAVLARAHAATRRQARRAKSHGLETAALGRGRSGWA